jgi:outer membrane protein
VIRFRSAFLLLGLVAAAPVLGTGIQVDVIPNFVGLGLGVTITGDGADSPIITQRGERDQISAGIGVGYSW